MSAFGLFREWFPSGQLKIEAHVIGGTADVAPGSQSDWLFDGESLVWDEQGRQIALIPYEKGALQGTSQNFYPNGQIQTETPYKQNLIEGDLIEYYPTGTVKEKTSYSLGIKQGLSIGYWPNGLPCWTEEYKNDLLQTGSYLDLDGVKRSVVENGSGFQTFFHESGTFQQIEIRKGIQEGAIKQLSKEGQIVLVYQIKQGKKVGEEIEYYQHFETDGQFSVPIPKISIQWHDDAIHGSVKTWYPNGSMESQKEFARNKKNGTSCGWYQDGNLMLIEEYEDDVLTDGRYFKKNNKAPISTIVQGNGVASLYDKQGIFLRKVIYRKGKPIDPED